jgi:hypothetical protein
MRATPRPKSSISSASATPLLRWLFVRGSQTVTCEILVGGRRVHDVCVVPHNDVSASVVERYTRPADALRRHAEIAWLLRETGWAVVHDPAPAHAA